MIMVINITSHMIVIAITIIIFIVIVIINIMITIFGMFDGIVTPYDDIDLGQYWFR